jgi:hypothetical protein
LDAEAIAVEEPVVSVEPGLGASEEHVVTVEEQEPEIEEEIVVPRGSVASSEEEEGGVAEAVRVVVGVTGAPSWLRVQEDRQIVLDQMSEPGFAREFVADRAVSIQASNAGAVRVEVDGQNLGFLGADGEVTAHTYTIQEGTEVSQ